MRVVVAGGSGFLGSSLVEALRRDAHQVAVLTRRARRPGDIAWSPDSDSGEWKRAIDGADAVVNLAGEGIADRRWTTARKNSILQSRVTATRALVAAINEARVPPTTLLSASGINVYGAHRDEPVTEDSPAASDFLANVCKAWESEAQKATAATRVVLLRSGMVIARKGGALPKLALPFHLFAGGPVGSGQQYMSWIHRDDWVSMATWALAHAGISGPLNVTAPGAVTNADFARTLGRVLHRPAFFPVPGFVLRIAVGEMADAMLLTGQRVVPEKAQSRGFEFKYPTLEPALRNVYR